MRPPAPRARALRALGAAGLAAALACGPAGAMDVRRVVSPGGVEAWLVPDRSAPLVTLSFAFRGAGWASDPEGRGGLAEMASNLLGEGAGGLDSLGFQRAVEDIAARLSFFAARDEFGGELRTLAAGRGRAFELLRLALTSPRFDGEAVSRVRRQTVVSLRRRAGSPRHAARRAWARTLFPDHPYGRPAAGTEASVAAVTPADLRGFVAGRLARDRLVVGVVGDIPEGELGERLDQVFGGLPARAAAPARAAPVRPAGAGATVVVRRGVPQSVILFGHEGVRRDDPDWYAAVLVNHVLGGGRASRLFREVRDRRGLAYSVASWLAPMDGAALVAGSAATRNARAGEAVALIRSEWRRIAERGVTGRELRDARSAVNGAFALRLDPGSRIAGTLVGIQLSGLGLSYASRRAGLFGRVTLADANRVARRLFRAADLTVVVAGEPAGVGD